MRSAIWDLVEQESSGTSNTLDADVHMSLASTSGSGDSGWTSSGGVKSDQKLWSQAADGVGSIRQNVKKGTSLLDDGQHGLGSKTEAVTGLATGAAQHSIYQSWNRYLDLLRRECSDVAGKLEKAGNDHYKNDEAVENAFQQQITKPGDSSGDNNASQGR